MVHRLAFDIFQAKWLKRACETNRPDLAGILLPSTLLILVVLDEDLSRAHRPRLLSFGYLLILVASRAEDNANSGELMNPHHIGRYNFARNI
jgi:hypothetical protein